MTDLEELKRRIEAGIPGVKATLDLPANPRAGGFLHLTLNDRGADVEWEPQSAFGVSSRDRKPIFGEGPDEVYYDIVAAVRRVEDVLLRGQPTRPTADLLLQDLRTRVGMSQVELAKALSVTQPTLSKIERRRDVLMSTVIKVVEGLGGTLEINARFPTGMVRVALLGEPKGASRKVASPNRRTRRPLRKTRQRAKS